MGILKSAGAWIFSNLLGILFSILVVALAGGFWDQLADFPRWSQALLIVVAVGLMVEVLLYRKRLWAWLRWSWGRPQVAGGPSLTLVNAPGSTNAHVAMRHIMVDQSVRAPSVSSPVLTVTPALLRATASDLIQLGQRLVEFVIERERIGRPELPLHGITHEMLAEYQRQLDDQSTKMDRAFRIHVHPALAAAQENARALGWHDDQLDQDLQMFMSMVPPIQVLHRAADRTQVLGIKMDKAADALERSTC